MDSYSFATSDALDHPVSIRIIGLEGDEPPFRQSTLLENPALRHVGSNISPHSDLYVTVQVWAGSKPLTVPVQTAYKPFRTERRWNEWLTLPITYANLPSTRALQKADGNDNSTTPASDSKKRGTARKGDLTPVDKDAQEQERMEKLFKKHEMGEIPRVDWLDQLVFRGFEKKTAKASIRAMERQRIGSSNELNVNAKALATGDPSTLAELDKRPSKFMLNIELPRFDFPVVFADREYPRQPSPPSNISQYPIGESSSPGSSNRLVRIYDPEVGARDNPADAKHRRLFRSAHRNGIMDKDLKPNAKVRDELNLIMSYGPTHVLTPEEMDLVWKFRYHLTRDKRALTKFVKSVNWQEATEAKQAAQLLNRWTAIDVDDALELFGPSFDSPIVRTYAVERLRKANDHDLLLYLLQLVQALKYEHIVASDEEGTQDSSLARFLISRAADNPTLGNYFHWYLMVECDDSSPEQDMDYRGIYRKVAYDFMVELVKRPNGADVRKTLLRQAELITILSKISGDIKLSSESIPKKIERVKQFLHDPKNELLHIDPPLPLPLDPDVKVIGVIPEETTVFKSSLCPIKVTFKTTLGKRYPIIFKTGDDLRQDQLVIQIITLMDQLLQKENLDLRLSPYKILATSTTAGASQFVPSVSFQSIASKYNNPALTYLKQHSPDDREALGIRSETLDTYVRSWSFFHADFGFILGRDPKPFAPVMKLTKEMYCFLAYAALRKSSNLILNLFSLMVDANIPDIRLEPDKAVIKVRERFHLELGEEDAIRYLERVIEDSLGAIAPVVIDKLHDVRFPVIMLVRNCQPTYIMFPTIQPQPARNLFSAVLRREFWHRLFAVLLPPPPPEGEDEDSEGEDSEGEDSEGEDTFHDAFDSREEAYTGGEHHQPSFAERLFNIDPPERLLSGETWQVIEGRAHFPHSYQNGDGNQRTGAARACERVSSGIRNVGGQLENDHDSEEETELY
ncbi:unnamed protein product [Parascedosporium putredinis]|uniref:Phosphatidylinositol 3-kinase VPS34 n=1 Tax=Parascedosporium putredinis TaxID=1442378 RepID=A0A9P1M7D5_9PEZI|nr:unnamed protein product [Parascedosporium putredinis]CAI7988076.1 unnamed protein product [Parascedosporium putredinis]